MYATVADLIDRFDRPENPELTQLIPDGGNPPAADETRLEQVIGEASGQMDLYLGTRHTLPIDGLSDDQSSDLTRLCCDIVRYRLWADAASSEVRQRYEDAMGFLNRVADGRVRLGTGVDTAQTPAMASGTRTTVYGADFAKNYAF